jgi:glycosyltransferase involved in cell wall biosynthesis
MTGQAERAPRETASVEPLRVLAIIAAFNEEDVIGETIRHLTEQGVEVYLIDNHSTDETVQAAAELLGRGLVGIESFPRQRGAEETIDWGAILRRKLEVAAEQEADWYIHHDADEIRESPWPHLSLAEGISVVDRLGFNCIDFRVLNFRPLDESFRRGMDPARHFTHYEDAEEFDAIQLKCWKASPDAVDLARSGGHEARFDGRRVFPVQFVLRHYPIRSSGHGQRKVFVERKGRFLDAERAIGWHVQYDAFTEGTPFVWDPSGLTRYEPDRVRLELLLDNRHAAAVRKRTAGIEERLARLREGIEHEKRTLEGRVRDFIEAES